MSDKVIVVVCDREDGKRGEITVVDNPDTAAHLVENLLEAGFDEARIRLFSGYQAQMEISSRPVVALVDEPSAPAGAGGPPAEKAVELAAAAVKASGEQVTPYMKDGVRFSSSFRAA